MKPLVIFGTGNIAQLAWSYFIHDSAYKVAGFTVDAAYLKGERFCGLPVVPFETVASVWPPDAFDMFVALSYNKLNCLRQEKYQQAKALGYSFASYISSRATVLPDTHIGENCFILEQNVIQPFARIGNNVTLWSGNHIGHHSTIGDHCFLASHAVVSGGVTIGENCFIGVNATLRDHIKVGPHCIIGAGALLMANAEADGVYIAPPTERSNVPSARVAKI